jgi:hypothetical protein
MTPSDALRTPIRPPFERVRRGCVRTPPYTPCAFEGVRTPRLGLGAPLRPHRPSGLLHRMRKPTSPRGATWRTSRWASSRAGSRQPRPTTAPRHPPGQECSTILEDEMLLSETAACRRRTSYSPTPIQDFSHECA